MRKLEIELPKKVFRQGEMIDVSINFSATKAPLQEGTIALIGKEKTEFTIQSIFGKTGFHPAWSFILPSRHQKEEIEFLRQTHEISTQDAHWNESLEVPRNAIPSYYGDNGKVSYFLEILLNFEDGSSEKKTEQIIIDRDYEIEEKIEILSIQSGTLTICYSTPLQVGRKNRLNISTQNLTSINPLRIILKKIETYTANRITINDDNHSLPICQLTFDTDLSDTEINFEIPSRYQPSYEGLLSRCEYYVEIYYLLGKKGITSRRERLKLLTKFQTTIEHPDPGLKSITGDK